MKSPQDIAARMQRQWQRKAYRLEMLTSSDAWPKKYSIGIPSATEMAQTPAAVRDHIVHWQQMPEGQIVWRDVNYRSSSEPIRMPSQWVLERPSEWVQATTSRQVVADYSLLEYLIGHAEPDFHETLITQLKLLQGRSRDELMAALALASRLKPGEAQGRPLRLLAGHGVDTKFFERNRQLLVCLLDARYDGEVSEQGLHSFLNATPDGEHWLMLMSLQDRLLPFEIQQVRSSELANLSVDVIRAKRILIVENRQCWHLLPPLEDTIAILGSGLDLDWLRAEWLDAKHIAYWGDMDTWGLLMLARVRQHRPTVTALLMNQDTFVQHAEGNAVCETVCAGDEPSIVLTEDEQKFYRFLLARERGRLEQEYLPSRNVHDVLTQWVVSTS